MSTEFLLWVMKKFGCSDNGYHNTVNILNASDFYTYEWLK